MKIAWIALMIVLASAPAAAAPANLGVEIISPEAEVDPIGVRAAIATELAGPMAGSPAIVVGDATLFAPTLGRLEIMVHRGLIRIAYHPAAGTLIERTLALPASPEERVDLIAFVATNLVRDQAGEILDDLTRPPTEPVIVIPPAAPPPPKPLAPVTRRMPATLGFVPPLSIDRVYGERVIVGAGLHALVGMTTGSEYLSISGIADIQHEFARGAQIGGVAAVSRGEVDGVQIGGVAAYTGRRMKGAQIGGVGAYAGRVHGAQIGGVAAYANGELGGLQIGGVAAVATGRTGVDGAQIGGVAAVARGHVHGLQIGGVASLAGSVEGVQIGGVANVAGDVRGVQIGVVNVARRMRGVQLGVVNISEDGDDAIPVGLINYAHNGRISAEGWVDSSQLSAIALRHGTKYVHNLWSVAHAADYDHTLVGAGLGVHLPAAGVAFDVDALHYFTNVWDGELSQLSQLRASIAVPLAGLEVFGGASANVYVADEMDESASFNPHAERRTTTSGGKAVVAWPTAFVGVRLRAR
jgi:hypothetical protein